MNYCSNKGRLFFSAFILLVAMSVTMQAQTTWEFSGTSYSYQKAHFDSATSVIKSKLGIQMHTFGAPYNQNDTTFLRVMGEDTNYKAIMFSQVTPSASAGFINLSNRVFIESATGVPDSAYFMSSYLSKKAAYTDYMVMQGHPYAWTTEAKQVEFRKIVNFLISEGVVFCTPYEYWQYTTDLSIPRTSKVHVILKLDDLRATTTYFYPCFAAYDFLVSKKVKAGFGVNNMSNLTQSQIDTLNYYLRQTDSAGTQLFEIWNHGLDHSQTSSTLGGNWSSPSTWASGTVPTSADDAEIPAGVTVTLDISNAVCQNLIISGTLVALNTTATGLTVDGDLTINSGGSFTSPYLTGATANIYHALTVYGDFTNNGTFDFRTGSAGTTMRVINTTFAGNLSSIITVGTYSSTNNDFNGITINKTGGAKVICGSDVFLDQGSSNCVSQLTLTSGIVETGNYSINALSTTTTDVVSASSSSYVNGALGRGMSNSAGKVNSFPVGDSKSYRPISVRSTTGGVASGHYCTVRCISGDASSVTTTYAGGIDKVSRVRYYQVTYNKGIGTGADTMSFSQFNPSYGIDDGVAAGNTDLRVAYSIDAKSTWTAMTQGTAHTTSLTSPPTTITPTALTIPIKLYSGNSSSKILVALAKVSGTTTNTLPVELTSFEAVVSNRAVTLVWNTATENNSAVYEIERKKLSAATWETVGTLTAAGSSSSPKHYTFVDGDVGSGYYSYRLKMVDLDGTYTYSAEQAATIGLPAKFALSQNYPNPFNPSTQIEYALPEGAVVQMKIYSLTGNLVKTLLNERKEAGYYTVEFNAAELPSGVYFYQLSGGGRQIVKKMMLLK
jgi:hypothetical protein